MILAMIFSASLIAQTFATEMSITQMVLSLVFAMGFGLVAIEAFFISTFPTYGDDLEMGDIHIDLG